MALGREDYKNYVHNGQGAITASRITRRNLAPDPSFERNAGAAVWTSSGLNSFIRSEAFARTGRYSMYCRASAGSNSGDVRTAGGGTSSIPAGLEAGKTYTVSAWVYRPARYNSFIFSATSRQLRIIAFTSTTGSGYDTTTYGVQGQNVVGWQRISHTFSIPANAVGAMVAIGVAGDAAGGNMESYVDDILFEEGGELRPYFDGDSAEDALGNIGSWDSQVATALSSMGHQYAIGVEGRGGSIARIVNEKLRITSAGSYYDVASYSASTPAGDAVVARVRASADGSVQFSNGTAMTPAIAVPAGQHVDILERASIAGGDGSVGVLWIGNKPSGAYIEIEHFGVFNSGYPGGYFDGDSENERERRFRWDGARGESTSSSVYYDYAVEMNRDLRLPPGESFHSVERRWLWFGNHDHMQWVPMPDAGMQVSRNFSSTTMLGQSGGLSAHSSSAYHKVFGFDFSVRKAAGAHGLDVFSSMRESAYLSVGFPGSRPTELPRFDGMFMVSDPMAWSQNVLPAHWALPVHTLRPDSWHTLGDVVGTEIIPQCPEAPAAVVMNLPAAISERNKTSERHSLNVAIPPTRTLHLGWKGYSRGGGSLVVRGVRHDGTIVTTEVGPIPPTTSARLNRSGWDGREFKYVNMYWGSVEQGAGETPSVTVASAMGRLLPHGAQRSEIDSATFVTGKGQTDVKFTSDASVESYTMNDPYNPSGLVQLKGLSFELSEVGAWA